MHEHAHDEAVLRLLARNDFLGWMVQTPDVTAVTLKPPTMVVRHPGHVDMSTRVDCAADVLFASHPRLLGTPSDREAEYAAISIALFEALMFEWVPGSTIRFDTIGPGFVVSPARSDGLPPWFAEYRVEPRPQWSAPGPDVTVYVVEGLRVLSWKSFFSEIGEAVNGPGGYFGGGLDSLSDCLTGGFGTTSGPFSFEWRHSGFSRKHLGYGEAIRLLSRRPVNRETRAALLAAEWGYGATPFDRIVSVFDEARIPLRLN